MDRQEYRPMYLKVERDSQYERDGDQVSELRDIINKHYCMLRVAEISDSHDIQHFGFLHEELRMQDFSIVRFDPFSEDCGVSESQTDYKTRDEALEAAKRYLADVGYRAVPVDLEGMLKTCR